MKLTIKRDSLIYAIQNVQRAISPKSPLHVLTGIFFQCEDGTVKLTATDMELSIKSTVQANTIENGSMVIPARYIAELAKKLPDLPIEIETLGEGNLAVIRYGQSEFHVNCYSAKDFPSFPTPKREFSFSMKLEEFKNIVRKVIYAVSNDDSRPVFTGVSFEIEGSAATLVATDTFRLALKKFKINNDSGQEIINVIVPGKTFSEAVRVMGNSEKIKITLSKNHIVFETEDTTIASRLISGRFPSYRQVIPENFISHVRASISEMLESADRASLLAGERNSLIMFQTMKNGIVISVRSDNGWIREDIAAAVEGENLDIFLNVRYLCDVLRSCEGEEIVMKLTGPYSPALLTSPEDSEYMAIIVPARIKNDN